MDSLYDLNLVENFLAVNMENESEINNTLFNIVNEKMRPVIVKVFKANRLCITDTRNQLKDHLVHMKLQESTAHLHSVGAIPRLYRKTNKNAPKEASQYVLEAVKPILEFQRKFCEFEPIQSKDILMKIVLEMTNQ